MMSISEVCSREIAFATRKTGASELARLMRDHHVGDLIIVDDAEGRRIPVGIITDRDLVIEILAEGLDPDGVTAGEIMSEPVIAVTEAYGLTEAINLMKSKGVRRVPVTDEEGALSGILALDDLIELFGEELASMASVIGQERRREMKRHRSSAAG